MPKFPKNTGFKLPGVGSKEIDTPGNFREDQGAKDVGYCDSTESHMLPAGSSPLLSSKADPRDWLIPDYYKTTYTGSAGPQKKEKKKEGEEFEGSSKLEYKPTDSSDFGQEKVDEAKVPDLVSQSKKGGFKTYAKAWDDNDSGIQQMYNNDFNAYVTDVSGQGETATKAAKRKQATEGGFIWDEDKHRLK